MSENELADDLRERLSEEWTVEHEDELWVNAYRDDDKLKAEVTIQYDDEWGWRVSTAMPNLKRWPSGSPWDLFTDMSFLSKDEVIDVAMNQIEKARNDTRI